jgi:hypothetical protein
MQAPATASDKWMFIMPVVRHIGPDIGPIGPYKSPCTIRRPYAYSVFRNIMAFIILRPI